MTTTTTDRTVAEIGNEIADEIELFGHYQATKITGADYGKRCVLTTTSFPISEPTPFVEALAEKAGYEIVYDAAGQADVWPMVQWNDTVSTDEVLATLRSL